MELGDKIKGTATAQHQAPRTVEEVLGDVYCAILHNKTGGGDHLGAGEYADAPTAAVLAALSAVSAKVDALAATVDTMGHAQGGTLTAADVRAIVLNASPCLKAGDFWLGLHPSVHPEGRGSNV